MLSKILTVVLIVSVTACEKEYKKSDNKNISTVAGLNKSDPDTIINTLGSNSNLSSRERYYLASAYSQKAGVDVFSLYSVMEIELFHKEALNWSDLSKEKNPYLKFMKGHKNLDDEEMLKVREKTWEKYLPKLEKKYGVKPKKTLEEMKASPECYCDELTQEEYDKVDSAFRAASEKILEQNPTVDEFNEQWYKETETNEELVELRNSRAFWELLDYYSTHLTLKLRKENYLNPDKASSPFGNQGWEMIYMNVLWNTYEAIPLMKKLPVLTTEQQASLTKALEVYRPLLDDKEFNEVSLKNLMLLSGVSLLSIYSSSFKLDEVGSMKDLFCKFEPSKLLDNYGLIRERLMFMKKVYSEISADEELYLEYKDHLNAFEEKLPKELTPEQRDSFIIGYDEFYVDSCFND